MMTEFRSEVNSRLEKASKNKELKKSASEFMENSINSQYSYNFFWLGRPIIQYPQDILAVQEIIWEKRPDVIIETGIAHGGSLILSASLLALLDLCEATENKTKLDPSLPKRHVIGVDIDIRDHNRTAVENHPLSNRITMIEGSSTSKSTLNKVKFSIGDAKRVMIFLDSNHTHEHVLNELRLYAPLISKDSYIVVFDTIVDDIPENLIGDRPWGPNNNPKTALFEYLKEIEDSDIYAADGSVLKLQIDDKIESKLLISAAPSGYLKRTKSN
tara:strand:- start:481 stop:1296 length:816 start_codon:yes stop_codon:yes gene_type:complete